MITDVLTSGYYMLTLQAVLLRSDMLVPNSEMLEQIATNLGISMTVLSPNTVKLVGKESKVRLFLEKLKKAAQIGNLTPLRFSSQKNK